MLAEGLNGLLGHTALIVGFADTFGKVLLPELSGMVVYIVMAGVLLWRPEGIFKKG